MALTLNPLPPSFGSGPVGLGGSGVGLKPPRYENEAPLRLRRVQSRRDFVALARCFSAGLSHSCVWLLALSILLFSGCQGIGPVEPTLAILPTETPRPSLTAGPEVTIPSPT